jgi:SagB-type dehydrogenase family enzyme
MGKFEEGRELMKSGFGRRAVEDMPDQAKGKAQPPIEKPYDSHATIIDLPKPDPKVITKAYIENCIADRCSRREFAPEPLFPEELSLLLWATYGVKDVQSVYYSNWENVIRTVPSAGARHAYETYVAANRVSGLDRGIYRYLSASHKLLSVLSREDLSARLNIAALGQRYVGDAGAVFLWACTPYRSEWRYHREAHKLMLLDVGHICQNLYLGAEAISCGCCAIGAYDQEKMDALLGLDGKNEFVVYLAAVGKLPE